MRHFALIQKSNFNTNPIGECRLIPECKEDELVDFPRRMREWLYNVMKELSERKELSYHYQQMEKEAQVIICEFRVHYNVIYDT